MGFFDDVLDIGGDILGGIGDVAGGIIGGLGDIAGGAGGIGAISSVLAGMYSLDKAEEVMTDAAAAADPFAPQRGQYQSMLQGLMTDPNSFVMSPAAQATLNIGRQNLERSAAAKGFLGSGNILGELMGYGQQVASQDYWKQIQNLQLLSGAQTGSPAGAGAAMASIFDAQQRAMAQIGAGVAAATANKGGGSSDGGGGLLGGLGSVLGGIFGGAPGAAIGGALGNFGGDMFGGIFA